MLLGVCVTTRKRRRRCRRKSGRCARRGTTGGGGWSWCRNAIRSRRSLPHKGKPPLRESCSTKPQQPERATRQPKHDPKQMDAKKRKEWGENGPGTAYSHTRWEENVAGAHKCRPKDANRRTKRQPKEPPKWQKREEPTAPRIPTWSPTVVLTGPAVA